ncbi:MAG: hypothetical protein GX856_13935 [Gammaproteobacteria bacterium]|nr:hypothetical protein [Gammaproteobacteria bacterium]
MPRADRALGAKRYDNRPRRRAPRSSGATAFEWFALALAGGAVALVAVVEYLAAFG